MSDCKRNDGFSRRDALKVTAAALAYAALPGRAATAADKEIVKSITFLVRKPGVSHAEFMRYWLEVHAPMALQIPGMRGMICNEILGPTRRRTDIRHAPGEVEIDGFAESWKEASNYPGNPQAPIEAKRWYEDGPMFVGLIKGYRVKENVFIEPKRGGKGLVSLLTRKPGAAREDFEEHWLGKHGPMARGVPGVAGLILNTIVRPAARDDIPPLDTLGEVDGIAQSWHVDQTYPGLSSPEAKQWYADGAALIGQARGYFTQEHVIIPPGTRQAR
jgi:hypothetical protein